jgi:alpha-tubulin suppressor-like RCC1 family protein
MFNRGLSKAIVISLISGLNLVAPVGAAKADPLVAPNGVQVAVGQQFVVAMDATGKVWTWGRQYPGLGGSNSTDTLAKATEVKRSGSSFSAVSIAATDQAAVLATTSGDVYAWGYAGNGLGNGSAYQANRANSIQVSFPTGVDIVEVSARCGGFLARSSDGAVYQWGSFYGLWNLTRSTPGLALPAGSVTGDVDKKVLSRGCSSAFAIATDGSFYAWGSNGGGKLGAGNTDDVSAPVKVTITGETVTNISASSTHTLAVTASGKAFAWGGNSNGQLGRNPSSTSYLTTPTQVGSGTGYSSVLASDSGPYSTAITTSGGIKSWGTYYGMNSNSDSYVPTEMTKPSDLSGNIVSGDVYQQGQAFVANDGSIWSRGLYNFDGNCGADSNSYSMWVNGRMQPPRTLVRAFSAGQFGSAYVEDQISINSLKTADGSNLALDGSGLITVYDNEASNVSVVASRPSSTCVSSNELDFAWDLDGDGNYSDVATVDPDEFGNQVVSGSTSLTQVSSRRHAGLKITNPDGFSREFKFDVRVLAHVESSGSIDSGLPYVGTNAAVGTNGKLYAWGLAELTAGITSLNPIKVVTADPDMSFTAVDTGSMWVSNPEGNYRFGVALNSSGQVFAWGNGPIPHPVTSGFGTISTSRVDVPTLITPPAGAGTAIAIFTRGNNSSSGDVFVVTSTHKVWTWGQVVNTNLVAAPWIVSAFDGTSSFAMSNNSNTTYRKATDGTWSSLSFYGLQNIASQRYNSINCPNCNFQSGITETLLPDVPPDSKFAGSYYSGNGQTAVFLSAGQLVDSNGIAVDSPAGQTVLDASGNSILMTDQSLWQFDQGENNQIYFSRQSPAGSIQRFASGGSHAVIKTDGSVHNSGWEGSGSCSNSSGGDYLTPTFFSDGNLGPAFHDDWQQIYLATNDMLRIGNNPQFARSEGGIPTSPINPETGGYIDPGHIQALHVYPNSSQTLTIGLSSSCVARSNLELKADLNDDGIYETLLTLQNLANNSPLRDEMIGAEYNQVVGEATVSADQIASAGLDLANAGGKYVGIQATSKNIYNGEDYVSTVRLPIVVEPKLTPGKYSGVSINKGAEFTESADVKLGLVWPKGAVTVELSNDGGFEVSRTVPLASSVNWRLSDLTSGKVGSVVYAKFLGLAATKDGSWEETDLQPGPPYTDNITMDLTPPTLSTVDASISNQSTQSMGLLSIQGDGSGAEQMVAAAVAPQLAHVTIDASDAGSGVTTMQVTSDPAIPGDELPYQPELLVPAAKDTIAVRVKDSVGNWSAWKYVRIAGFISVPTTPTVPVQPQNPPTVVTPPVTQAPSVQTPAVATVPQVAPMAPKAKLAAASIATQLQIAIPAKSKVTITVAKSSKAFCKVSGGKLVALKPGNCAVTVTVQAPKPKGGKKPAATKQSTTVQIS